jgi:hypothetical protein
MLIVGACSHSSPLPALIKSFKCGLIMTPKGILRILLPGLVFLAKCTDAVPHAASPAPEATIGLWQPAITAKPEFIKRADGTKTTTYDGAYTTLFTQPNPYQVFDDAPFVSLRVWAESLYGAEAPIHVVDFNLTYLVPNGTSTTTTGVVQTDFIV